MNPFARALTKVYYKRSFLFVYGLLTTVTLSLIIYDASIRGDRFQRDEPVEPWFIALDVACVLCLVLELVVRLSVRSVSLATFWCNVKNDLDLLVVILCIFTLFPYAWIPQSHQLAIATLVLRYTAQVIRLFFFMIRLRTQHSAIRSIEDTNIDLDLLADREDSFYITPHGRSLREGSWGSLVDDSGTFTVPPNLYNVTPENISSIKDRPESKHTPSSTLCFPMDLPEVKTARSSSMSVDTDSIICVV